jgi:hypothetical protein
VKERYTIWVVYEPYDGLPEVVSVEVEETSKQAKILKRIPALMFRVQFDKADERLTHRTPEAAVKFWHKLNVKEISSLERRISELKALNAKTPRKRTT